MKKLILLLVLILAASLPAAAETAATEPALLEGIVIGMQDDGYLVYEKELGEVLVLVNDETVIEANAEITIGDYIYADHNGQMTRSIPAQITATVLRMFKIEGEIVEHMPDENSVLLNSAEYGDVVVFLPDEFSDQEFTDTHMLAYFNGAMTMSLPAQIGAGMVIPGYSVSGIVTEIADDHIMLGEDMTAVQVFLGNAALPDDIAVNTAVRVQFDGQLTRSIPMQLTADSISPIVPAAK